MSDIKTSTKRWEDMETDVLVKMFKELNMIELVPVSQVCRSWRLACSDPLLWSTVDLGLLKSNFILTRASPYIWVDDRSDRRLTRLIRIAMNLSHGNVTCMVFHFNLYMKDDHLNCIAERCPQIKKIVLPAWNRITRNGICQAMRAWQQLESMTMPSIGHPPYIMKEISQSCKNFTQLKIMGSFDVQFAISIAKNIPKLKVLSLRCSMLTSDALLHILDVMDNLEVLNISHSILLEGSPPFKMVIKELDQSILQKTLRLREFYHCQSTSSCLACERIVNDEGCMRWWKYEEWFWRQDEISSLHLGDYGPLFDQRCADHGF